MDETKIAHSEKICFNIDYTSSENNQNFISYKKNLGDNRFYVETKGFWHDGGWLLLQFPYTKVGAFYSI